MPELLVVKDDAAACEALAGHLRGAGYDACTATAVPAAMQILKDRAPDLLITEVRLKGYNGLHLVAMAPQPLPAIVVTAQHDPVVEADARRLGAEYLSGPFSVERLRLLIAATLRQAEARGVFLPARIDVRSALPVPPSVRLGTSAARMLDVSAGGARLEVQHPEGRALAASLMLQVQTAVIPVEVAWQRPQTSMTVLCGVSVDPAHRPTWGAVLSLYGWHTTDAPHPRPPAAGGRSSGERRPPAAPLRSV